MTQGTADSRRSCQCLGRRTECVPCGSGAASAASATGGPQGRDGSSMRGTGRVTEGRVLLVSAFGAFLAFLDATIVNVAFPSIRESFPGTSIGELSWVLNAYNIVFAAFLIVCGRLA